MTTVKRNYINTRFTFKSLDELKTVINSENTYNDCTFYMAIQSPTGEITKIIEKSTSTESPITITGVEGIVQKATFNHCVIQYNASVEETMNVAKIYKDNTTWTIESSSGTKKTLTDYMSYLDIKLGSTPTYDNIVKYAWPLVDNFICSEAFDFTPTASNKLKYVPFEASKLTEASINDMVNLTTGNQTYVIPDDLTDTATLNLDTPGAFVRFINLKTYDDQNTKNIKLHSVQSNIAERQINILCCPKEISAITEYIGFEVKELDNDGTTNVALKIKSFDFTAAGGNAAFKTVCYIEGLNKSLTETWSIEADYIYIKNLNIDYMQFINAKEPSTNVVNKISSAASKLTFTGASSDTAKTLMFTNLYNVDMSVINGYSAEAKTNFNVDGVNIINGYNINYN